MDSPSSSSASPPPSWAIFATIPLVCGADADLPPGADLSLALAAPPGISTLTVPPRVSPDSLTSHNYPSVLAVDRSGASLGHRWGIAGNANEDLQIGDVTIPEFWAHLSLWNWQRYSDGPANELPLEAAGDYTREFGFLNFSDYTVGQGNRELAANTLNSIWYQPEEIFPVSGTPKQRQHAFWVPVSKHYYDLAGKLETLKLPACVNGTRCLPRPTKVTVRVPRGCSANLYTDNASYRQFIRSHFGCTPVEMESAAVALVAHQLDVPFLTIRSSLSNLTGGGSSLSNEAATFLAIAAQNAVDVMLKFVPLLGAGEKADM